MFCTLIISLLLTASIVGVTVSAVVKLAAVVAYTPSFLVPGSVVAILGLWLGNVYIKAQLSVKREMSNAKSPVLGILGGAIGGLSKSYPTSLHLGSGLTGEYSFYQSL